jgi:PiT family inorganic phosphate transporter
MIYLCFIVFAVLFVAYANGANDNFKGVATLFGSGTTGYRGALAWGTLTTFAGSVTAVVFSATLVAKFSGKGLVPDALVGNPHFVGAVAIAAALTVILATLLSFPISTTHALTGALVGAGLVQAHGNVKLSVLGAAFFLPLIVSPVASMVLAVVLYPALHGLRNLIGLKRETCVCVERKWVAVALAPDGSGPVLPAGVELSMCQERYQGTILSVTSQNVLNGAHYLSAGAVSFARGLNDTPKIVALLIAAQAMGLKKGMVLVGIAMAVGAVIHARKIAETMAHKITRMNHGQGFVSNVVTAGLVLVASRFGLPVSTTHVSCGSLFGIGAVTGQARWKTIVGVLFAWVVTLPLSALLAAIAAWII